MAEDASIEAQLRASRARILAAADRERREIERSLHDGIQQDLVALAVKLQLFREVVGSDAEAAQRLLGELRDDVQDALDGVRRLAERIYPPLLRGRGLAEALRGLAATRGATIRVEGELGRYPPEIEEAVYFCCRDALEPAGGRPLLRIWAERRALRLDVTVDSSGLSDSDLAGVRDRVEALGGDFALVPDAGAGTRVSAAIPLYPESSLRGRG